jgi:hypothetical protein
MFLSTIDKNNTELLKMLERPQEKARAKEAESLKQWNKEIKIKALISKSKRFNFSDAVNGEIISEASVT